MKIRIYQLINPVLCGSPRPGFFNVPEVSPYAYECELVSNDNQPAPNVDKIGYHDNVIIPSYFPVQDSHLRALESYLNGLERFLTESELFHEVYMHLKPQFKSDVTVQEPEVSKKRAKNI